MSGCASFFSNYNKDLLKNDEFDSLVRVEEESQPSPQAIDKASLTEKPIAKVNKEKINISKKVNEPIQSEKKTVEIQPEKKIILEKDSKESKSTLKHEPALEDGVDFVGRRPLIDPFRVGEKVILALTYFGVEAGKFEMSVEPFKNVNGIHSYHFKYRALSSQVFSWFYKVDDYADIFVSYDNLVPLNFMINVKESGQVRDTRGYFDWKSLKGFVWDKKIPKDKPLEEKKYEWAIESFAQTPLSVAFYFRTFKFEIGKEYKVRVANDGENLVMTIKVLRKEVIDTVEGKINTLVIKPTFEVSGIFKPTGENFVWVTDDDRKQVVRIESKIRIGTIVAKLEKLIR